ncbi:VAMP-associated protein [Mollisia scopiformis]|uniref:VAMP-associated protein n=1 Tax=Mollisia scopiformis TaxID=149040 RepID=A0A194WVY8_MOLSC|nr:VAMP-associated protein [Mollisia scopiformis]KUJ12130.1 VAMP-associated protein [Mollisia scopiformis]
MSVEIDPVELGFHRPFTSEVSQALKIRNPNMTPVAFKVKTTAPKQYCVRPNSGRIEPGKEVEVTVLLQAMKQEPPIDAKCRDKFLVQSVAVTSDKEFTNITEIHVDQAEKSSVQEKKIRVVYLPAGANGIGADATPLKNGVNGTSASHETPSTAPPAYSTNRSPSPPEETFTPETRRSTIGPQTGRKNSDEDSRSVADAKSFTSNPSIAASMPQSMEELKAKLAEAQATIATYTEQAGIRARKVAKGETSNETVNQLAQQVHQAPQGVPLQIVAGLCLLSFLLAYFFF